MALLCALGVGGCALNGDFGRLRPELVYDDMHDWVGRDAVASIGGQASKYPLTDNEHRLRDLAYPLVEPPANRSNFDSMLREYGLGWSPKQAAAGINSGAYWVKLRDTYRRSEASAYAQLVTDARNDLERIDPFFRVAGRVTDMDGKRTKSLAHVSYLTDAEFANANNRNLENAAVVGWVCRSLYDRAAGYRFALEHLVIAAPSPSAVDAERSVNLLSTQVANRCQPEVGARVVAKD